MARKHNSKKESQAKARAKAEAAATDEFPARAQIAERAAEEQAKMDAGAVKDVTLDPNFTPAVTNPDAGGASSKSVPTDPDWADKMRARGKGDVPPSKEPSAEPATGTPARARSKDVQAARAVTPSRGQVKAPAVAPPASKAAKGTRGAGRKTARKGNRAGTVKTGV